MKKPVIILLHIGYWIMFLLLLLVFFTFSLPMLDKSYQLHRTILLLRWGNLMLGFAIVPAMIAFYVFYLFLFDRFLKQNKTGWLFLSAVLVAAIAALTGALVLSFIFKRNFVFTQPALIVFPIMSFGALINGIIGLVMKGFISWYGDIKLKEELNKKNYEMELALVKSQINPHFLFNTISNIDVLIEKDPAKASGYLNKLSDIMRFMLYETKTEEIPLVKELTYIEKYVELQKIRTSNPLYVNYHVTGDPGDLEIAPMLFIPFVENAFKHTENKKIENAITIGISIEKSSIVFNCENVYSSTAQTNANHAGLGHELIEKRLNLLYPGRHTLKIMTEKNIYKVKLVVSCNAY